MDLGGRSHYYFRSAVHHEIPHCEILHFVPVFLFGMTTLLFLLPVDKICENDVILARRGVGSFPPQPLQLTNRINSGNDLTLHSPKAPLVEEVPTGDGGCFLTPFPVIQHRRRNCHNRKTDNVNHIHPNICKSTSFDNDSTNCVHKVCYR